MMEQRAFDFELVTDSETGTDAAPIRGLAVAYNVLSEDLGSFRERILPGAFAQSIETRDVAAVWNHNSDAVLGRLSNRTLQLHDEADGLRFDLWPPDTQAGRDAVVSIRRKDVYQCSFMFDVVRQSWADSEAGRLRTLEKCELYEISPVAFPAYAATSVQARSVRDLIAEVNSVDFGSVDAAEVRGLLDALADRLPAGLDAGASGLDDSARARLSLLRRKVELGILN